MTSLQDKLYWRLWAQAARVNGWRMAQGRLRPEGAESAQRSAEHAQVWAESARLAAQGARAVTAEDLRHGCTVVAAGRLKTHRALTNPECDRLFALLRLLIEPVDLGARMQFDDPNLGEQARLVRRIRSAAPLAYIDAICRDRFAGYQPPAWEELNLNCLRMLAQTLRERTHDWTQPVPQAEAPAEAVEAGEVPF